MTTFAAASATLLLLLSTFYIRLSGAVMIGLPALALAVLSVAFLVIGKQRWWTLIVSAGMMALALETKLFVAALFPAICLHLFLPTDSDTTMSGITASPVVQRLVRCILWLTVTASAFFALSFYFHAWDFDMLLNTHFGAQTRSRLVFAEESRKFLADFFRQQPLYLVLALMRRANLASSLPIAPSMRFKPVCLLPHRWLLLAANA